MNPIWRDIFRRNASYKILSLAISVLLYFVASAQNNPRSTSVATVRATFLRLPGPLAEPTDAAATLSVRLVGPSALHEAARAGLRAMVDASDAKSGRNRLPVRFVLPPGVEGAVDVDGPQVLDIVMEAKVEREVPVEVWFDQSNPPAGFEYGSAVVEPRRCTVAGLGRAVERVARVAARIDDGAAVVGPIDREVSVVALDDGGMEVSGIEIRPQRVRFKQALQRVAVTRTLVLNPRFSGKLAPGQRLSGYRFDPETIVVQGGNTAQYRAASLDVPISLDGLSATETRPVSIPLPDGIRRIGNTEVRIRLEISPSESPDASGTPPPTAPREVSPAGATGTTDR